MCTATKGRRAGACGAVYLRLFVAIPEVGLGDRALEAGERSERGAASDWSLAEQSTKHGALTLRLCLRLQRCGIFAAQRAVETSEKGRGGGDVAVLCALGTRVESLAVVVQLPHLVASFLAHVFFRSQRLCLPEANIRGGRHAPMRPSRARWRRTRLG